MKKRPLEEAEAAPRRGPGQPTKYNPELGRKIAEVIAQGIPLRALINQLGGTFTYESVRSWQERYPEFGKLMAEARVAGFERYCRWRMRILEDTPMNNVRWRYIEERELSGLSRWQFMRSWDPRRWRKLLVERGIERRSSRSEG